MPTLPAPDDKQFETTPQGNHIAVCYRVIDLGTQQVEWKGQIKHQRKVLISWEIPDEKMQDGRPFTIGQRSHGQRRRRPISAPCWKAGAARLSRKLISAPGLRHQKVIGVGCMLNVVHAHKNGKTYANIASVAKLPKGVRRPAQPTTATSCGCRGRSFIRSQFRQPYPMASRALIQQSPEYKSAVRARAYRRATDTATT
jgi:hypothetical protein